MELQELSCIPCRKGDPRLSEAQIKELRSQVSGWEVVELEGVQRLEKVFKFDNFKDALVFTVKVGNTAEAEDHHPTIALEWGKVTVTWWTHAVKGLHQNDFIMAAKTDQIYGQVK
jgi:4a-hydroxytetrahydrobiopterin dehydratase